MKTKKILLTMMQTMAQRSKALFETPSKVSLLQDLALNLATVGSGAGGYFGFKDGSTLTLAFAVVWFAVFFWFALVAAGRVDELQRREASVSHRKMAGTVRSVVRSEVRTEGVPASDHRKEVLPSGK